MMNQLFIRGYKQWRDHSMIREIENRRSIRKYKPDELDRKLIEEIIYSASLAPSAKNRQPWKFIVYKGEEKDKLRKNNS